MNAAKWRMMQSSSLNVKKKRGGAIADLREVSISNFSLC